MQITRYCFVAGALSWIVAGGICVGTVWGVMTGWNALSHGFLFAALGHVADRVGPGILYALMLIPAILTYEFLRRSFDRFSLALVAAGIFYLPLFAFCGYRINQLYLPGFLELQSVLWNSVLSVVFIALWFLIAMAIFRWRDLLAWSALQPGIQAATLLFLLILHAGAYFHGSPRFHNRPGVLIILIDALRADHLSCYGYTRETTPNIDRFARDSVIFTQAISHSSFTKTSIASLFTSLYPFQHGVYVGSLKDSAGNVTSDILPETEELLSEALLRNGFLTAAWVHNPHLRPIFGFSQGFVRYESGNSAERANKAFIHWLQAAGQHQKFAAYLHYLDLHDPYRPDPPYEQMYGGSQDVYRHDRGRWGAYLEDIRQGRAVLVKDDVEKMKALYDGQLTYIDTEIGKLFQELRDSRRYDNLMIILTADHGDGFMEHGFISHSTAPYDELIRVPLIIKFPESRHRGNIVSDQVQLVDVMPTVLKEMGQEVTSNLSGVALQRYLQKADGAAHVADELASRLAYSEFVKRHGDTVMTAIRSPTWKYLHFEGKQQREELYNLASDPKEQTNVIDSGSPLLQTFREKRAAIVSERQGKFVDRRTLDEETIRRLRSLGYIK